MDQRYLEHIYQQWSHGMSNASDRWIEFIELAARQTGSAQDEVMRELQKYSWFKWGEK